MRWIMLVMMTFGVMHFYEEKIIIGHETYRNKGVGING